MLIAAVLAASVLVASVLVAGCANQPDTRSGSIQLTPISPSRAAVTPAPGASAAPSTPSSATATAAPAASAPIADVIAWVEAAGPVDGADFGIALRNGVTTPLAEDVAFTTPSGTSCMTDTKNGSTALACLVNLIDPPPQPPDIYGAWKGGWVDFDGAAVQVGSAHGDPGRFSAGQGPPLPTDRSLSFGDFRCRTDTSTLICVNYANRTAVRYDDAGIETYGCTRESSPESGVGIRFTC